MKRNRKQHIQQVLKWAHWINRENDCIENRMHSYTSRMPLPLSLLDEDASTTKYLRRRPFHHVLCIFFFFSFSCLEVSTNFLTLEKSPKKMYYLINFCVSRCFRYLVATASVFGLMLMNNQCGIQSNQIKYQIFRQMYAKWQWLK